MPSGALQKAGLAVLPSSKGLLLARAGVQRAEFFACGGANRKKKKTNKKTTNAGRSFVPLFLIQRVRANSQLHPSARRPLMSCLLGPSYLPAVFDATTLKRVTVGGGVVVVGGGGLCQWFMVQNLARASVKKTQSESMTGDKPVFSQINRHGRGNCSFSKRSGAIGFPSRS